MVTFLLKIWVNNTFASQLLVFERKNEQFFLENASNLTQEFLYDNFNKKILLSFLVKFVIQFFKEKWFIFSLKKRRWEAKVLNIIDYFFFLSKFLCFLIMQRIRERKKVLTSNSYLYFIVLANLKRFWWIHNI